MKPIIVSSANMYYIAQFSIKDYDSFINYLKEQYWKTLEQSNHYDRHSINLDTAEFLGLRPSRNIGLLHGEYFYHEDCSGIYRIFNNGKVVIKGRVSGETSVKVMNHLRLYLYKEANVGLAIIGFAIENIDCEHLIKLNYDLHKIDKHQSPEILVRTSGTEYSRSQDFGTVGGMVRKLLNIRENENNPVKLLNEHRLRVASCMSIDSGQECYSDNVLNDVVAYMSTCYTTTYKLPEKKGTDLEYLFDNIVASAYHEGVCAAVVYDHSQGSDNFEANFLYKFRDAYLPLYVAANMAESIISTNSNRANIKKEEMIKILHKVKCLTKLPVSQYHHLIKFYEMISKAIDLPKRNEALVDYFEYERLERMTQLEKYEMEMDKASKERERNLSHIAFVFTVIQFIFLLLSFFNLNSYSDLSMLWRIIVCIVLSIIFVPIAYLGVKTFKK